MYIVSKSQHRLYLCVQVIRWLAKHGPGVRMLAVWTISCDEPRQSWSRGAAGLLALTPNLLSLQLEDSCGFFLADYDLRCLRHLTLLQELQLYLKVISSNFSAPATSEPLCSLTALKSLTFSLDMDSVAIELSQHLSKLTQLTEFILACPQGYGRRMPISCKLPQLCSLRKMAIDGPLEKGCVMTAERFGKLEKMALLNFHPHEPAVRFSTSQPYLSLTELALGQPSEATISGWSSLCHSLLHLPALRLLEVFDTDLRRVTDSEWTFHPELRSLALSDCCLEFIPAGLQGLTSLTFLDLTFNLLSSIPNGPYLKQLSVLSFTGNEGSDDESCLADAATGQGCILGTKNELQRDALAAALPQQCTLSL